MATRMRLLAMAPMAMAMALLLLLAVVAPAVAHADEADWLQPVLVESLSAVSTEGSSSAAALATAQAEAAHAALLAPTVTAEGKTDAELRAEIASRGDKLFDDFKKAFKRDYGWAKLGAARSAKESAAARTFLTNLITISELNKQFSSASIPVHNRVVFSHMTEYADMDSFYFGQFYLGAKLDPEQPLYRSALVETDAQISADADANADADADAEAEAEVESEADAEAEVDASADMAAEAEAEADRELTPAQTCEQKWYGRCVAASSCPDNEYNTPLNDICDNGKSKSSVKIVCCTRKLRPSKPLPPAPKPVVLPPAPAPNDVDWRSIGTPIKSQGDCATAWAMAGVAVVESGYSLKFKTKCPALSVQEVLDFSRETLLFCDSRRAMTPLNAMKRMGTQFRGALHDSDYPYVGKPSKEPDNRSGIFGINERKFKTPNPMVKKVEWVLPLCYYNHDACKFDENAVGQALNKFGPLSAMIDASALQFYKSGVLRTQGTHGPLCEQDRMKVNHAVVIEGLGTDKATGQRYWIVRNSWGTGWGESGRMRMEFGQNTCSIASWNTYATF